MVSTPPAQRRFEPLERKHDRAAFSCGTHPALDDFLKTRALQEMKKMASVTYVLLDVSAPKTILGYYSLTNTSVLLERIPLDLSTRIPKYPQVPGTLLARLARDMRFKGRGIGETLLIDALLRSYRAGLIIDSAVVIVDAIDAKAAQFYMEYGFMPFADQPKQLFQTMKSVSAVLLGAKLI